MATTKIKGARIVAIGTCVPSHRFDNVKDTKDFTQAEIRKVVAMAGVQERRLADDTICSTDLCVAAAEKIIRVLNWDPQTVDAVIMVTQTPDYFLPSSSCLIHKHLGLSENCAAFDIGLGCSGYPYGLWMTAMMMQTGGFKRILLCHGDTPGRYSFHSDRSVVLLFGDAGSATAIEASPQDDSEDWFFSMYTDGNGYKDMIIEGGAFRDRFPDDQRKHYVTMNGANVFNFTIKRLPSLIEDTLQFSGSRKDDVDYFIFHQSNQYILKHVMKKVSLAPEKVPMTLKEFGNPGGPSIPLTITKGGLDLSQDKILKLMLLGYGVGLSWASALIQLHPGVLLEHMEISNGRNI